MGRPKASVPTERLCVTLPADEVKKAKGAAAEAGVTWADFVRQALLSQAAIEHGPRRQHVRSLEAPSMERLGIPRVPVVGHRHSAAKVIAGGIGVCECGARRTVGSGWVEP